jgi:hypothetical protein
VTGNPPIPLGRQLQAALQLMRPAQWPILSAQFFLAVLLISPRAMGGGCWLNAGSLTVLATGWLIWVVLLNGGTLAFNSAFDRDEGPVAYLDTPPLPPTWLAPAALGAMLLGVLLAWLVLGQGLALVTGGCVLLSVLYSAPGPERARLRWKSRPGLDLLVNMVGYGAGTTLAGLLVGSAAYLGGPRAAVPLPLAPFSPGRRWTGPPPAALSSSNWKRQPPRAGCGWSWASARSSARSIPALRSISAVRTRPGATPP